MCFLLFDKMASMWNGMVNSLVCFVDLGDGVNDVDSIPCARDALVLMVVSLNRSWKVPVGYFLVNGLTGVERANFVRNCLKNCRSQGCLFNL